MKPNRTRKKNLIVSYKNLSDELKERFKETYPEGYRDYLQRFEKPNGDIIFVAPMETEDTAYMVKFDVKIDTTFTDDDIEKDFFDEQVDKADEEFAPLQEAIDKEEGDSHVETRMRHGNYEDLFEDKPRKHKGDRNDLHKLGAEISEAFSDNEEEYDDDFKEDDVDAEDDTENPSSGIMDREPTDEELMDLDSEIYANAEIPPEELERMKKAGSLARTKDKPADTPAPRKRGRPRKNPLK